MNQQNETAIFMLNELEKLVDALLPNGAKQYSLNFEVIAKALLDNEREVK